MVDVEMVRRVGIRQWRVLGAAMLAYPGRTFAIHLATCTGYGGKVGAGLRVVQALVSGGLLVDASAIGHDKTEGWHLIQITERGMEAKLDTRGRKVLASAR